MTEPRETMNYHLWLN